MKTQHFRLSALALVAAATPSLAQTKKPEFITPPQPKVQAPFQSVDLSKATGAKINESAVQTTLLVDAAAKTGGDGSAARPFASFGAAYGRATELLKAGTPVRIRLAAGVYREGDFEIGFPDDAVARATPLIIEGAEKGKVIFSGADVFSDWKDEGEGVYSAAWPHEFGFHAGLMGQNNVMGLLGQRREMVFVGGKWLHPVILEDTDYTLEKLAQVQTTAGQHGGGLATDPIGTWTYKGLNDPKKVLFANSFGVTERAENGKRLYLKLAENAAPTGQTIEATTRKQWARIVYKDNVVLRNLTIQQYGSPLFAAEGWARKAALQFGKPGAPGKKFALCNDVVIEDVQVGWNAGAGFSFDDITDFTVRRVTANYNGGGNGIGSIVNMVWEDVETNFNNWRGQLGNKLNWAIAGTKFHMFRDAAIRRHTSVGNLSSGIWMDINCENFAVDDATVVENRTGVFYEISKGPMALRRSLLVNNGVNVRLVAAEDVALEDNLIYQARGSKKVAESMDEDTGELVRKLNSGITYHFYNRSSMKNTAQWDVFGTELLGKPRTHQDFWLPGPVKAQNNVIVTGDDAYPLFFQLFVPPAARTKAVLQQAWQGRNNVYYSTNTKEALFTDYDKPENSPDRLSRIALGDWQKRFDEKSGTRLVPTFRDAENYDFRLKAGDPLQARTAVPFKQLDEKTLAELREWKQFVAALKPYESGK